MSESRTIRVEGMAHFWETGMFSDVKVRALNKNGEERTYDVHKVIVCGKSEFFQRMLCGSRWKEAEDGAVDMTEDHPGVVEAMLKYMYLDEYDYWHENDVSFEDKLMDHARIHVAAIKYCVKGLPEHAAGHFEYEFGQEIEEYQAKALVRLVPFLDAEIPENTFSAVAKCLQLFVANNHHDVLQYDTYYQLLSDYGSFSVGVLQCLPVRRFRSPSRWTAVPAYASLRQWDESSDKPSDF